MSGNVGDQESCLPVVPQQKVVEISGDRGHWHISSGDAKIVRSGKGRRQNRKLDTAGNLEFFLERPQLRIPLHCLTRGDIPEATEKEREAEGLDRIEMAQRAGNVADEHESCEDNHPASNYDKIPRHLLSHYGARHQRQRDRDNHHIFDQIQFMPRTQDERRRRQTEKDDRQGIRRGATPASQESSRLKEEEERDRHEKIERSGQAPEKGGVWQLEAHEVGVDPHAAAVKDSEQRQPEQQRIQPPPQQRKCRRDDPDRDKRRSKKQIQLILVDGVQDLTGCVSRIDRSHAPRS